MSEFTKRRPRVLVAVLVSTGAFAWLAFAYTFSPDTTAVHGDAGTAYFQCSGFVTSTRFWISGSRWSRGMDERHHYAFTTYRPDALARIRNDTLEVFSAGLQAPPDPDLEIPVRSVVLGGYEFGRLGERVSKEGLQLITC